MKRWHTIRRWLVHAGRVLVKAWHRHRPAVQRWLHPRVPFLKRVGKQTTQLVYRTLVVLLLVFATAYLAARLYLPTVIDKKQDIEAWLSEKSAHQVRIGQLETHWRGWYPGVRMDNVRVYAGGMTVPAVQLRELYVTLNWIPLIWGELRIDRLRAVGPQLSLERLRDGRFRVSGFAPVEAKEEDAGRGENFVNLLLRQYWLEIDEGELQWVDHREPGRVHHFKNVNLTLVNRGKRHRLEFKADFPAALCRDCSFEADIRGNPFLDESWGGLLRLRTVGLNVAALPKILSERLPKNLAGHLSLDIDSHWRDGGLREIHGHVRAADMRLPLPDLATPLILRQASGVVHWRLNDPGWGLEIDDFRVALAGQGWDAGRLRFEQTERGGEFELRHFNIGDVTAFARELRPAKDGRAAWLEHVKRFNRFRPGGELADLRAEWRGPLSRPENFRFESDVLRLSTEPVDRIPGVRNLTGRLSANPKGGEFLLDSAQLKVLLPAVFEQPLEAGHANGRFRLVRGEDHWLLDGDSLEVEHPDARGHGRLLLRIPDDREQQPHLKLRVELRNGNGANAARYYPRQVPASTLAWMRRSFVAGRVTEATLVYDGQAKDFPFHQGGGRFEIRAQATNMVYAYLPGWKPLTAANAELHIDNARVEVRGAGRIGDLEVDNILVSTAIVGADSVQVGLRVRGPFDGFLRTLQEAKPPPEQTWKAAVPPTARGRGQGELNLKVEIPFGGKSARLAGDYQLRDAALHMPGANLWLEAVNGKVGFTEQGPVDGRLRGRLLGGDVVLQIATPRPGELRVAAVGAIRADSLAPLLGRAAAERITGEAAWEGSLRLRNGVPEFHAEADLPAIKVNLPPPFSRPNGLTREKLIAKTVAANRQQHLIELRAGPDMHGRLMFANEGGSWRFSRGRVGFGQPRALFPTVPGLHLEAHINAINLADWKRFRREEPGGELPAIVKRLSAQIGAFDALDRRFGSVAIDLARATRGWQGSVQGQTASGRLKMDSLTAPKRLEFDLAHLRLPDSRPGAATGPAEPVDPNDLPALRLRAGELIWKDHRLGRLEIDAEPLSDGWSVGRLVLIRPEANFTTSGTWRVVQGRHQSEMNLTIRSSNAGETLKAFGIPDQLDRGKAEIRARLNWTGPPTAFSARVLRGDIELKAEKGSFVQLKEGAGRLIGILDVSSILRVLVLDLNPIFGRGFVYDRLDGRIVLDGGNAFTQDLNIKGTVARVSIDGRVGLAKEDFDLRIIVDPQLSGTVATGTWALFGPGAAAAIYTFQKLFKRQISEGTRITYVVKGSWKNPTVTKLPPKNVSASPADRSSD